MKLSLNIMAVMASLTMVCTAQSSLNPRGSSASLLAAAEASYPTCSVSFIKYLDRAGSSDGRL